MTNLEILQEIKKEYDPKTAFGNEVLIDLLNSIIEPNKKGEFEVDAEKETKIWLYWRCPDCGRNIEENFGDDNINFGDTLKRICQCGKKHKLTII